MALGSAAEFLKVLERSRLLDPEQWEEAQRVGRGYADAGGLAKELARREILTRWQAGQVLAGRTAFFLGNYKLIELLGRGGMGSVFLGEHTMMRRRVALKVIPRQLGQDPAALKRFFAEVRTIASLDHPNIVQAYNVDAASGRYYMVMEYVEGVDLQRLVEAEGPLQPEEAVFYIRQAADGLEHAHARNLIHCDVKPSNLIVNPQGVVKILDLGLARLGDEEAKGGESPSDSGRVLGSVDYLAPEQALETPEFDHRADIYALGCTLYFLLTGEPPYPRGTLHERILKHQTAEPPDPGEKRSDVPASLSAICHKAMAKKPAQRYATAGELSRALAEWRPEAGPVKRTLPVKKTQPLEDLVQDTLIGFDLSELPPVLSVEPKLPEAMRRKKGWAAWAAGFHSLVNTRPRMILTTSIAAVLGAALLFLIILLSVNGRSDYQDERPVLPVEDKKGFDNLPPPPLKKAEKEPAEELPPPPPPADRGQAAANRPAPESSAPAGEEKAGPLPVPGPAAAVPPEPPPAAPPPVAAVPPTPPKRSTPPAEPLKDLSLLADLPVPLRSDAAPPPPVCLARIPLKSKWKLELTLLGGDLALQGLGQLQMRPENPDGAAKWVVALVTAGKEQAPGKSTDVAQLACDRNELTLVWMKGAGWRASALKNCALHVAVRDKKSGKEVGKASYLPLRRPLPAPPLTVNLTGSATLATLEKDTLLDASRVKLEVFQEDIGGKKLLGPLFPPCDVKAIEGEGGLCAEILPQEEQYRDVILCVGLEKKRGDLAVGLAAFQYVDGQKTNRLFSLRDLERIVANWQRNQKTLKKQLAPEQYEEVSEKHRRAEAAADLFKAMNKKAVLQYRVYLPLENYQLELFSTKIAPPTGTPRP